MPTGLNIYYDVFVEVRLLLNPGFRLEALNRIRSRSYECPLTKHVL